MVRDCSRITRAGHPAGARHDGHQPGDRCRGTISSRDFRPGAGVPEDPVTGSAHCAWAPSGRPLGKADLVGYQVPRAGAWCAWAIRGDRVKLGGRAITMLRGRARRLTAQPTAPPPRAARLRGALVEGSPHRGAVLGGGLGDGA